MGSTVTISNLNVGISRI